MLLCVFFPVSYYVVFPDESSMAPGDELRRDMTPLILTAMKTEDWSAVQNRFDLGHAALLIGDRSGVRWEAERGWIRLDGKYAIASETKMITALAVYRVMARSNGLLRPDTRVAEWLDSWPQDPATPAGRVTLANLLSLTTGWNSTLLKKARCWRPREQTTWAECADQLAQVPVQHEPGESFLYGAQHLVVAAAVAQRARGRPLTMEAWAETVRREVFFAAGLEGTPDFSGSRSDFPPFFPRWGSMFRGRTHGHFFPDFAGGMRMSGRQYQHVLRAVMFGGLLPPDLLQQFWADHTSSVTRWLGHVGPPADLAKGTWHYAQGAWIPCDPAARAVGVNTSLGKKEAQESLCGPDRPEPEVLHSLGYWGFYAWMDRTNGFYGVFVYSWAVSMVRMFWISLWVSVVVSLATCYVCGACLAPVRSKRRNRVGSARDALNRAHSASTVDAQQSDEDSGSDSS